MNFFIYKKGVGVLPYKKTQYEKMKKALMGDGWRPATHEEVIAKYPELKAAEEKKSKAKKATPQKKNEAEN